MKSILQESSSIAKAVEKAWQHAGMPAEFSVKVLDKGEKNFLGFSKKPAIISFSYPAPEERKQDTHRREGEKARVQRPAFQAKNKEVASQVKAENSKPKSRVQEPSFQENQEVVSEWSTEIVQELVEKAKYLLKEMWEKQVEVEHELRGDELNISYKHPLGQHPEEEQAKILHASMSYILFQHLKRKHKKQFKGLRLHVTNH